VLLEPLRRALERQGFRALNWHYRSLRGSIEAHAAHLTAKAKELNEDTSVERLHFVGHSMGAIVVRSALAMGRPRSSVASYCSHHRIAVPGWQTWGYGYSVSV
jgi:alpha-beta hydrolase superfamily lysophospholipase